MDAHKGRLLRVLGVAFGWAVTVGTTLGAGILRAPGEVAANVPGTFAFYGVWLAGGAYALLGALSLAELGTMFPESGGQTVYVRRALGAPFGFAVAFSDWISTAASAAVITIVLLDAVAALVPAVAPWQRLIAAGVLLAFAAAQWRGVRTGAAVQLGTTALKTFAFAALIIACLLTPSPAAASAVPAAAPAALTLAGIVLSLQAMIYTYDGWSGVLYFSGEVTDPGRSVPRSMMIGVWSVIAIYLLVNAAFLHLVPLAAMAGDPLVADTVAGIVFGTGGVALIRGLIAVSLLSAINACILQSSRVLYAAGVDRVNDGGTPVHALAVSTVVAMVLVLTGTFAQGVAFASFFFVANYTLSFISVFVLRRREPALPRPYRAWGFPYTTATVLAASLAFLVAVVIADTRTSLIAMLLLLASYPVYRVLHRRPA